MGEFTNMRMYYYRVKKGRNAGIIVTYGHWPLETLVHRGYLNGFICTRAATPEEIEVAEGNKRYQSVRYRTLDALLIDEADVCTPEQLAALTEAMKKAGLQTDRGSPHGPDRESLPIGGVQPPSSPPNPCKQDKESCR